MGVVSQANDYELIVPDQPGVELVSLLGEAPARWGRMSLLSRMLLVKIAQVLHARGTLGEERKFVKSGKRVGLVGATKRGSIYTDLAFIQTMEEGLPSPALFGYTLPNIPLAEAALFFGLTGPVYAMFEQEGLLAAACEEASRLMSMNDEVDMIIACEFDHIPGNGESKIPVNLTVLEKNVENKTDIPQVE